MASEYAGFTAGFMVSEHFHPWTPQQGQNAFAWSFMGALGTRTSLPFGMALTCPGFQALRARSVALTGYLLKLLDDLPVEILTPREPSARGAQLPL